MRQRREAEVSDNFESQARGAKPGREGIEDQKERKARRESQHQHDHDPAFCEDAQSRAQASFRFRVAGVRHHGFCCIRWAKQAEGDCWDIQAAKRSIGGQIYLFSVEFSDAHRVGCNTTTIFVEEHCRESEMFEWLSRSRSFTRAGFFLLAALSLPVSLAAQQPWEGRPFSGRPSDIATAARSLPDAASADVVMLLDETQIVLDASGRSTVTWRAVYRIGTKPPEDWAAVGAVWRPWHQQKPSVRARVITADGREVQLDEKALTESPLASLSADTFTDGRILRAPLPAVFPGAVVELQTVIRDTQPLFDRGIAQYVPFGKVVPVLRTVLVVEAPSALPLRHVIRLLPGVTHSSSTSGRTTTFRFESGRIEA